MVKSGETEIAKIVAATAAGSVLPPCGRCREMLYQIDERNLEAEVIVGPTETVLLRDLLPRNWQNYIDVSLRN
jgi:cytidine deaminase